MSYPLFKANIRSSRTIWVIMTAVFCWYMAVMVTMYDPKGAQALEDMLKLLPDALIAALGFSVSGNTLLSYLSGSMYGALLLLFPMVISIVVNHGLIAAHVDRGSMAYLLAMPASRSKIAKTQALFSLTSITVFFAVVTVFGIAVAESMFPGELEIGRFVLLNFYALLMYAAIGGIGFFASCIAGESRHSLSLGVGIPMGFMVLQMLGRASERYSWAGNLSLYSLFDPFRLIEGSGFAYAGMALFAVIALLLYAGAIAFFNRRDLHV